MWPSAGFSLRVTHRAVPIVPCTKMAGWEPAGEGRNLSLAKRSQLCTLWNSLHSLGGSGGLISSPVRSAQIGCLLERHIKIMCCQWVLLHIQRNIAINENQEQRRNSHSDYKYIYGIWLQLTLWECSTHKN